MKETNPHYVDIMINEMSLDLDKALERLFKSYE